MSWAFPQHFSMIRQPDKRHGPMSQSAPAQGCAGHTPTNSWGTAVAVKPLHPKGCWTPSLCSASPSPQCANTQNRHRITVIFFHSSGIFHRNSSILKAVHEAVGDLEFESAILNKNVSLTFCFSMLILVGDFISNYKGLKMWDKGLDLVSFFGFFFSTEQMIHIYKNKTRTIRMSLHSSGLISKILIRANPIYIAQARQGKSSSNGISQSHLHLRCILWARHHTYIHGAWTVSIEQGPHLLLMNTGSSLQSSDLISSHPSS